MWKSNDICRRATPRHDIARYAAALLLLALAPAATAGLDKGSGGTPGTAATAKARGPVAGQQLRCWQYGRLIFEENGVAAPPDSTTYALRMHADESRRTPLLVVNTGTATCLIKGVAPAGKP